MLTLVTLYSSDSAIFSLIEHTHKEKLNGAQKKLVSSIHQPNNGQWVLGQCDGDFFIYIYFKAFEGFADPLNQLMQLLSHFAVVLFSVF